VAKPIDILVVDDNPLDAHIFQEVLRQASPDACCHWLSSGEEAITFLRDGGSIKLVLLDINMPGLNGFETLSRIRSNPDLSRIPVVFLSSTTAPAEVDRSYLLGGNAFFSKPTSLDVYVRQIRTLVDYWLHFAKLPSPVRIKTSGT